MPDHTGRHGALSWTLREGVTFVHELGITEEIVGQITARTHGRRVTTVHLQIGRLAGVVPDSVRFCFELVTEGTQLEGAALTIEEPAGEGACSVCGATFPIEQLLLLCPCGSTDVRIVAGEQLLIESVEVA
jgi:hydrogenase nickel incorporation protein HypA/HybF